MTSVHNREIELLHEIEAWEKSKFVDSNDLWENSRQLFTNLWMKIDPELKIKYIKLVDTLIFHLSTSLQNSKFLLNTKNKIIQDGKAFNHTINDIFDLRTLEIDQLIHLANHQKSNHQLLSLLQGGISGTGNYFMSGIDIPLSILLQSSSVQRIGMCYGYNVTEPFELLVSLKLFNISTLPNKAKIKQWNVLEKEVIEDSHKDPYFFDTDEQLRNFKWDRMLYNQFRKVLLLTILKQKFNRRLPVVGVLFGGLASYKMTNDVMEIANKFYQKRLLKERHQSY